MDGLGHGQHPESPGHDGHGHQENIDETFEVPPPPPGLYDLAFVQSPNSTSATNTSSTPPSPRSWATMSPTSRAEFLSQIRADSSDNSLVWDNNSSQLALSSPEVGIYQPSPNSSTDDVFVSDSSRTSTPYFQRITRSMVSSGEYDQLSPIPHRIPFDRNISQRRPIRLRVHWTDQPAAIQDRTAEPATQSPTHH